LEEAVGEAVSRIEQSNKPIIIAGVEMHRFALQDRVLELAEAAEIPIAATMLGKSVVRETHPLYVGLYEGALGDDRVTKFVENSDCILLLGTFMSDINLGIYTANLDAGRCIYATSESLRIGHHHYHGVMLEDFVNALAAARPVAPTRPIPDWASKEPEPFVLDADAPISITRLVARLNESLDDHTIVAADIGDALFAATELVAREQTEFLSPAYYTSMGFAVPAVIGAHFARPHARIVAIVGDGAFQMTGVELSTAVRYGLSPIVIVLNNEGYGTERFLHAGNWSYNEIQPWQYHKLPEVLGGGRGFEVRTEGEFDVALREAWDTSDGPVLIHAHISRDDCSQALHRLADKLKHRV
jgi:indolepyruvate decarboxylase